MKAKTAMQYVLSAAAAGAFGYFIYKRESKKTPIMKELKEIEDQVVSKGKKAFSKNATEAVDSLGDKVSDAAENLGKKAEDVSKQIRSGASNVKDKVADASTSAKDKISEWSGSAKDHVDKASGDAQKAISSKKN